MSKQKKWLLGCFALLFVLALSAAHKVYAAKSISLNSPVSFPVDI